MQWQTIFVVMFIVAVIIPTVMWFFVRNQRVHRDIPAVPVPVAPEPVVPFFTMENVRIDALRMLSAARRSRARDEMTEDGAQRRAAEVTRQYIAAVTQTRLDELSPTQLQAVLAQQPALSSAAGFVTQVYPSTFTPDETRSAERSICLAEQVVLAWRDVDPELSPIPRPAPQN